MRKSFWNTFFAALLAIFAYVFIVGMIGFFLFASMIAMMGDPTPKIHNGTIVEIDLSQGVSDSPLGSQFSFRMEGVSVARTFSLMQVLRAIETAKYDDKVLGLYLNMTNGVGGSIAAQEEIRGALKGFKESGKFVVSYGEVYSQKAYHLASVGDKIYLNPHGSMNWHGMTAEIIFYKGMFDKLGIEPTIFRLGDFKSAAEPYIMDKMSPENREQTKIMVNSVWEAILEDISESRGIEVEQLNRLAENLSIRLPQEAVDYGVIDALLYEDQMIALLDQLSHNGGDLADSNIDLDRISSDDLKGERVSLSSYIAARAKQGVGSSKNIVAVIYVDGEIRDGESSRDIVGGTTLAKRVKSARESDKIKAVVLRVNSPGGSAMASEVMWRELDLLKQKKPLIVSMGGYAASGGYYISAPADVILTNKTTLTGSIGVIGMLVDVSKGAKNILGLTVDKVKTNTHADMGSIFKKPTAVETEFVMAGMKKVYSTFVEHVAEGRNMTFDEVDAIGGGRVWTGSSAVELGLADGYGGILDAIMLAVERAGLGDNFRVSELIEQEEMMSMLLDQLGTKLGGVFAPKVDLELEELIDEYSRVKSSLDQQGVRAAMPYELEIVW